MARGSIKKRYKSSWSIVVDMGYKVDPATGKKKRDQRYYSVKGTKRDAEEKLTELLYQANHGTLVEPSKCTVAEWLDIWMNLRSTSMRPRTIESYQSLIDIHLKPNLGNLPIQKLQAVDLEQYYIKKSPELSQTTLEHHHAVISGALKAAMKKQLVFRNVAQLVENRPKAEKSNKDASEHCWAEGETRQFLEAAKSFGLQSETFYTAALETGMRKGELCGLCWDCVDLQGQKLRVMRQLVKPKKQPEFGPTKNGQARTVHISARLSSLLQEHKKSQAELKMRNRQSYNDHNLVFAKEWNQMTLATMSLGDPLQMNNIGQREFAQVIKKAELRTIKFHGMRHTTATLLLKAGIPIPVVSERLGHKSVEITMNIYQHVLPDMQEEAAEKISGIIFGV